MKLTVDNLHYSYGQGDPVLNGVSFEAGQGEIICILGPNGCGKSTLLDNILGVLKPQSGTIKIEEKDIFSYSRSEYAGLVCYVPQQHNPTFPYTVREVVAMGCEASQIADGEEEMNALAEAAMQRVGILQYKDKSYMNLSGGELRLVLLARALCQDSPFMLMDEPTAYLDYRNELEFLQITAGLAKDFGKSIILATHSPDHAFYFDSMGVRTKAAFIESGRIDLIGSPDEVITAEKLALVYGVDADILQQGKLKTVLLKKTI